MIQKNANPLCGEPFMYFRGGRIYVIDHSDLMDRKGATGVGEKVEHFWLCPACCCQSTFAIRLGNGTPRVVLYPKAPISREDSIEEDARECKAA